MARNVGKKATIIVRNAKPADIGAIRELIKRAS